MAQVNDEKYRKLIAGSTVDIVANGIQLIFPYGFLITSASQLIVFFDGVIQTTGFTIDGVGNPAGGNVTFAVAPLDLVTVTLSRAAHVRDLEIEWLLSQLGVYTGPVVLNDLWMALFDGAVIPAGHFNDRAYAWLGSLGHTQGQLNDRWLSYWSS